MMSDLYHWVSAWPIPGIDTEVGIVDYLSGTCCCSAYDSDEEDDSDDDSDEEDDSDDDSDEED